MGGCLGAVRARRELQAAAASHPDILTVSAQNRDELAGRWYDETGDKLHVTISGINRDTIRSSGFENCKTIAAVTICTGVRRIGESAFAHCSALKSVTFPHSLEIIGDKAFSLCRQLTAVDFPDGLTRIGSLAFSHGGTNSVIFPPSVRGIGSYAWSTCKLLTTIDLGSVQYCHDDFLGIGVFQGCPLLTTVTLPPKLKVLQARTFYNCIGLKSITLPSELVIIAHFAFTHCISLVSINLPPSVTTIMDIAFSGCQQLQTIEFPEKLTTLGDGVFQGCESLSVVTMPRNLATVGTRAFAQCPWLAVVTVQSALDTEQLLGTGGVFEQCERLAAVVQPNHADGLPTVLRGCAWPFGADDTSPKARFRASRLEYWSLDTHHLCSPPRRAWVIFVLLIARKLQSGGWPLPPLPNEMWLAILEFVPRWELGLIAHEWRRFTLVDGYVGLQAITKARIPSQRAVQHPQGLRKGPRSTAI